MIACCATATTSAAVVSADPPAELGSCLQASANASCAEPDPDAGEEAVPASAAAADLPAAFIKR